MQLRSHKHSITLLINVSAESLVGQGEPAPTGEASGAPAPNHIAQNDQATGKNACPLCISHLQSICSKKSHPPSVLSCMCQRAQEKGARFTLKDVYTRLSLVLMASKEHAPVCCMTNSLSLARPTACLLHDQAGADGLNRA
eukprot:832157-Pelagomonas_calceolata.AAC.1